MHAAGVLRDSFLIHKTREELEAVLAPKVAGVENLDRATSHRPLDIMILFSSMAGALGNVGQADYAAANAYLDAYAAQRGGRTISINWPLWAEGGMGVDAETERALAQRRHRSAVHRRRHAGDVPERGFGPAAGARDGWRSGAHRSVC